MCGEMLDTVWLLRNHVIGAVGVGDLHTLEASSPLLVRIARGERFRKNSLQVVVYVHRLRFNHPVVYYAANKLMQISREMAGLRYSN